MRDLEINSGLGVFEMTPEEAVIDSHGPAIYLNRTEAKLLGVWLLEWAKEGEERAALLAAKP